MAAGAPLRIGVLLDDTVVPAWIADLLRDLAASEKLDLAAVLLRGKASPGPTGPSRALFDVLRRVDARLLTAGPDPLEPTSLPDDLAPAATSLEDAGDEALDVMVLLASAGDPIGVVPRARLGAWTVTCAGARLPDDGFAAFQQMSRDEPILTVRLLATLAGDETPRVLRRAVLATDAVSLGRSFAVVFWKAARLLSQELRACAELGPKVVLEAESLSEPEAVGTPARRPSTAALVSHVLRVGARGARSRIRKTLWREQWFVAYRAGRGAEGVDELRNLRTLCSPRGHFFADPFPIEVEGRCYFFFEDYLYADRKAVISFVELAEGGHVSRPKVALARDYHLSYPFVFKKGDEVLMLPETAANDSIELYRAVRFPDRWERASVLLSGIEAYDATLLEHDDRLWLFAAVATKGSLGWDELSVFWADALEGPWRPHPRNPVKIDVRSARPAGKIFLDEGRLIRPAQDCTHRYGRAIVFNEIEELSETDYRERVVGEPKTLSGAWRTHSYNAADGYVAVDGTRLVPRLPLPWRRTARTQP
jgi:hypothetical protein